MIIHKRTGKRRKKLDEMICQIKFRTARWWIVAFVALFPKNVDTDISFLKSPDATTYAECGQDITLEWQYNTANAIKIINWYQVSQNTIDEKIAFFENNVFESVSSASYDPANEGRIEYVANAGLKIKTVKPGDATTIRVEVLYAQLIDQSLGSIVLHIIVLPTPSGTPLSSITVSVGDANAVLVCAFEGSPKPIVTWSENSTELVTGVGKITISDATTSGSSSCSSQIVTSTLTISSPDENDIGTYMCTGNITVSQNMLSTQSAQLIVQYAPNENTSVFTVSQSEVTSGTQVTFTCQGISIPNPTYQISFDGKTIGSGGGDNTAFTSGYTVGPHDDGEYVCAISNIVGSYNTNVTLIVNVAPQFWMTPNSIYEIDSGSSGNITCSIYGDPFHQDNITWSKSGGGGSFTEDKATTFSNETVTYARNSLIIATAQQSDFGTYTCTGTNKVSSVTATINIKVRSASTISLMSLATPSVTDDENTNLNLECTATGYPKPVVTWKINGTEITLTNKQESVTETNGQFTVMQTGRFVVTKSHAGVTGCYASNGVSPDASSTTKLIINYEPTVMLSVHHNKTLFDLNGIEAFQAALNETILLVCEVIAQPEAQITWRKNNVDVTATLAGSITRVVNNTDYETRTEETLELSSVQISDNNDVYECRASNSKGTTEKKIKILVLYGYWVRKPTNVTYGAVGLTTTLPWEYFYTQDYQLINWKDGADINSNTIGSLNAAQSANLRANNDYDRTTKSGFIIKNTQLSDEGWYGIFITFQNSPEVLQDAVYVTVIRNPHSTVIQPKDPGVVQYSNVTLTCTSVGKPAPTLKWYKGNDLSTELSNNSDLYIVTSVSTNSGEFSSDSMLTLINVSFADATQYTCIAESILASETRVSTVVLLYTPVNTTLTADVNPIVASNTLTLTCMSTGYPTNIYYSFFHNGALIQNSTSQQLILTNIAHWYAGNYECLPVNMIGNGTTSTVSVTVQVPPFIYETNSPHYVEENSNAQLICRAYGNPKPEVYWQKVSGPSGSTDNLSPTTVDDFSNSTLSGVNSTGDISSVTKQDQGIYECMANSTLGEHKINITLAVQHGAIITNSSLDGSTKNFTSGDSITEWCMAEGSPQPAMSWTLDGQPITRHRITTTVISSSVDLIKVMSYITINDMDQHDNGLLTCTASNNIASSTNTTTYSVKYPPKLSSHPKSVEGADISGKLQLSCVANSKEISNITWKKDGVVLTSVSPVQITETINTNLDQISSTLVVQPVSEDTLGNYVCIAANSLGSASDTTSVTIYSAAKITSFPSASLTVRENTKNYGIECVATGSPLPEITWYFDNSAIVFPSGTFQRTQTNNVTHIISKLTIGDVTKSQYGNYKCEAKNVNSIQNVKMDSATTQLAVQHDPQFVNGFPEATYTVNNYDNVTITCRVQASPVANVYISLPSGVTQDSRFSFNTDTTTEAQTIVTETNLTITNVTKFDYGSYTCFANNSFNSVTSNPLLNVLYPPTGNTTQDTTVNENSNLLLQKTVVSNPISTPQFYYEGSSLNMAGVSTSSSNAGAGSYGGTNLNVRIEAATAKRSMSGSYEVLTCNSLGCRSDKWNLIVYYAPQLESASEDKTVAVSNQVILECVFTVNPPKSPVSVEWQKGSATVSNGNDINIDETTVQNNNLKYTVTSRLTLSNIAISSRGEYTCVANNVVGSNSSAVTVKVHHAPIITTNLPVNPIRLNEGALSSLFVTVSASPQANFTWHRNVVDKLPSTDSIVSSSFDSYEQRSELSIRADATSSGVYYMKTCNQYGCVMSENATIIGEFKPSISIADQTVIENNTKSLECIITAEPQAQSVSWYLNTTTPLSNNAHVTIDALTHTNNVYSTRSVSRITITDAKRDLHAGQYTCKATNSKGESSADGKLIVQYPVRLVSDVSNITVIQGNALQLAISVTSNPIANFIWSHEGEAVEKIYNFTYTFTQKAVYDYYKNEKLSLIGPLVTPARGGWYEVEVDNQIGSSIKRKAYVEVIWPAKFIIPPTPDTANIGDTKTFTCRVQAYPQPKISWEKSPSQVISSSQYTQNIISVDAKSTTMESVLTIPDIKEPDNTDFTCIATNDAGVSTASARLNVLFPPRLLVSNSNIEIEKGHTLNLSCSNAANPTATQEWKKEGVNLVFDGVYYSVVATDCVAVEGTYTCTPKNSVGSGGTVQYVVTCISPPSVTVAASCDSSTTVTTCQCNGTGYPPPQIYWQKFGDSTIISTGDSISVTKNEADDGSYICKINNTAGSVTTVAAVALFGPLTGEWSNWGSCGPECSTNATKTRTRNCNENVCYDPLQDSESCTATCSLSKIPTMDGAEDEPLIALYILAPIVIVLIAIAAVALAQYNAMSSNGPHVIRLHDNPYPPNNRSTLNGDVRHEPKTPAQEAIEVNLLFEDDDGNFINDQNFSSPQTTGTLTSDEISAVSDNDDDQFQYVNTATAFPEG